MLIVTKNYQKVKILTLICENWGIIIELAYES